MDDFTKECVWNALISVMATTVFLLFLFVVIK